MRILLVDRLVDTHKQSHLPLLMLHIASICLVPIAVLSEPKLFNKNWQHNINTFFVSFNYTIHQGKYSVNIFGVVLTQLYLSRSPQKILKPQNPNY